MNSWIKVACWFACCVGVTTDLCAQAQTPAQCLSMGLQAYNQKNYRAAAMYFERYMSEKTPDANATYYLATSQMQAGNLPRAKQLFEYIISVFPGTKQAQLAQTLLSRFGSDKKETAKSEPSAAATEVSLGNSKENRLVQSDEEYKAEFARLPQENRIPMRWAGGQVVMEADLEGRTMRFGFAKGWETRISVEELKHAGIAPPKGPAEDTETDEETKKKIPLWITAMTIKLGQMTRKIPVTVLDTHEESAELGRAFLEDLQYEQDTSTGHITLRKKGEAQGTKATQDAYKSEYAKLPDESQIHFIPGDHGEMFVDASVDGHSAPVNSLYDVPCVFENERDYVSLDVGGKKYDHVLIDTGASATILSLSAASQLGVEIPRGARYVMGGGVGGSLPFAIVNVDLQLGPVTRREFPVMIGGNMGCAIGQDFMSGWRFTVDRDKKLLRFFH